MAPLYPLIAALTLLGYWLLKLRLNRIAQPLRLRLAERGEELLADKNLPVARREVIEYELDSAFGSTWEILVVFLFIPVAAIWCAFDPSDDKGIADDAVRGRADDFDELAGRISLLNHPILMPMLYGWLALWFIPSILISAIAGNAVRMLRPPHLMAALKNRMA